MTYNNPFKSHVLAISLILLAVSLATNLYCNTFSPLRSPIGCLDPSCFYTAGTAWANGMLPYVDFADVKGPFLFFLYFLGCAATPSSTLGVFFIHVAATYATVELLYSVARIYTQDNKKALFAALCTLPLMYWSQTAVWGAQCELLLLPFYAWLLLIFVRLLHCQNIRPSLARKAGICMGIGGMAVFLTKYNFCISYCVAFVLFLYLIAKGASKRAAIRTFIPWCIFSALAVAVPLIAYMAYTHSLDDFVDVYFLLNLGTYYADNDNSFSRGNSFILCYSNIKRGLFSGSAVCSILTLIFFFACILQTKGTARRNSMLSFIFVAGGYASAALGMFTYYHIYCSILPILPLGIILSKGPNGTQLSWTACSFAAVSTLYLVHLFNGSYVSHSIWRSGKTPNNKEAINLLSTIKHPRIIYLGIPDMGYGVPVSALPAIPEWTNVNGAPKSFAQHREQGVRARKADFIFALEGEYEDLLTSAGYVKTGIELTSKDIGVNIWKEHLIIWGKNSGQEKQDLP